MTDSSEYAIPRIGNMSQAEILLPYYKSSGEFGPVLYNAPEMCQGQNSDFKIDTWSFGVILHFLLTGRFHVEETRDVEALQNSICNFELDCQTLFNQGISHQALDLLQKCLVKVPSKRLTIRAALRHPWFKIM